MALSKEAQAEGLFKGMKVSLARKMSHSARFLPYNRTLYSRLNNYIYLYLNHFTPIAEPSGYGKFYLDMTGMDRLLGNHRKTGYRIVQLIREKISLAPVIGISINKLVSRISTAVVPENIYCVVPGEEAQFLSPLKPPVIPTAHEPAVSKIIHFLLLKQIREIQAIGAHPNESRVLFGIHAPHLLREARGEDTSRVKPPVLKNHILEQIVLKEDTNDEALLQGAIKTLAEQTAFKLRQRHQIAKRVRLEIHYTDGFSHKTFGQFFSNHDVEVIGTAQTLFNKANTRRNRIRSIIMDTYSLRKIARQQELFSPPETKDVQISDALDTLRKKHGFDVIRWAAQTKN